MSNPIFLGPGYRIKISNPEIMYSKSELKHGDAGVVVKYTRTQDGAFGDHMYLVKFGDKELEIDEGSLYDWQEG